MKKISAFHKWVLIVKWSPAWFFYGTWPLLMLCTMLYHISDAATTIFAFCLVAILCSPLICWQVGYFLMGLISVARTDEKLSLKSILCRKRHIREYEQNNSVTYYGRQEKLDWLLFSDSNYLDF